MDYFDSSVTSIPGELCPDLIGTYNLLRIASFKLGGKLNRKDPKKVSYLVWNIALHQLSSSNTDSVLSRLIEAPISANHGKKHFLKEREK
jgi:hypothetical protein